MTRQRHWLGPAIAAVMIVLAVAGLLREAPQPTVVISRAPERPKPVAPSVAASAPKPARPASLAAAQVPQVQRRLVRGAGPHGAPAELLNDPDVAVLKLKSGFHEPVPGAPVAIRAERERLLAQFRGPLTGADRAELARLDVRVLDFVPNRAFVLDVPKASLEPLRRMDSVRAVGNLFAQDKCQAGLLAGEIPPYAREADGSARVRVTFWRGVAFERARELLAVAGGHPLDPVLRPGGQLRAKVPAELLEMLAGMNDVAYVEPDEPPRRPLARRGALRSNVPAARYAPYGVTGSGVKIGMWDSGAADSGRPDFEGRVVNVTDSVIKDHATVVAGVIAAAGPTGDATTLDWTNVASPEAAGASPGASVHVYDFNDDDVIEMLESGVNIANHSWGHEIGNLGSNQSLPRLTIPVGTNSNLFGLYSGSAAQWDHVVLTTGILIVKAAGDEHLDEDGRAISDGYYENVDDLGSAKNVITVGAVDEGEDVEQDGSIDGGFGSWGPCDDGRVKPDLVASGSYGLAPCSNGEFIHWYGTSVSAASISGQLALFLDAERTLAGRSPRVSRVRSIAFNSTSDLVEAPHANTGPDYSTGYGLLDVQRMLALTFTERTTSTVRQTLAGSFSSTGETTRATFAVDASHQEIRLTLAWTDPVGSPIAGPALVNDLDLRLIAPDGTVYFPWVLDPSSPATAARRLNNAVDNVEQISVTRAEASSFTGTWEVVVRAGTINSGPQTWDLASSVAFGSRPEASAPAISNVSPAAGTVSGVQDVSATVTAAAGRTIALVQYRVDSGPWLAMVPEPGTGQYRSMSDLVVTTASGAVLTIRAVDDATRETRASVSLTYGSGDDRPDSAASTTSSDSITVDAEPAPGVIRPAGSSPETGDFFRVSLNSGQRYTFECAGDNRTNAAELTLFGTDGTTQLASVTGDSSADLASAPRCIARIVDFAATATGTHYLRVRQTGSVNVPRWDYTIQAIETPPFARFTPSATSVAAGASVTFTNTSLGGLTGVSWNFGDSSGITSTSSPTHTFSTTGTFDVVLSATGPGSGSSFFTPITVSGTFPDDHPGSIGATTAADDVTIDGPAITGRSETALDADYFRVTLANNQRILIDAALGTAGDVDLAIYKPSNLSSPAASNISAFRDSFNSPDSRIYAGAHLDYTAGSSDAGVHYISVTHSGSQVGTYTLRVRSIAKASDLAVSAISAPASLASSQFGVYTITISNSSSVPVTAPFTVGVFNTRNTANIDSTFFAVRDVHPRITGGVAANSSTQVVVPFFYIAAVPRHVHAVADLYLEIPDSNIANNYKQQGSTTITLKSRPPLLVAGPERAVAVNSAASLSASASDPDGGSISYSWRQISGPASLTISNASAASASVTPTQAGRYRFAVTASDGTATATAPQDVVAFDDSDSSAVDVQTVSSNAGSSFRRGTSNIPVTFTARNTGAKTAIISSAGLVFKSGSTDVSSSFAVMQSAGAKRLTTGESASWSFVVAVSETAPIGSITVHGSLVAADSSDSEASSPATWTIGAVPFVFTPSSPPSQAQQGQSFTYTVSIHNRGESNASSVQTALTFSGAGITATPQAGNPAAIAAGATATFAYDVTVSAGASTGARTIGITATAAGSSVTLGTSESNLGSITVVSPPSLKLTAISAGRSTAAVGQTIPVTVSVQNIGEASAQFTGPHTLVFSGSSITVPSVSQGITLASNATTTFTFTATAASVGSSTITSARFTALSTFTGAAVAISSNTATSRAIAVQGEPNLVIQSISSSRTLVSTGQSFAVTVSVANTGGSTAVFSAARLNFTGGLTVPDFSGSRPIAAGSSGTFTFSATASSALNATVHGLTPTAVNSNSGQAVSIASNNASPLSITIQSAPRIQIKSISAGRTLVSSGEVFDVTATFSNEGTATTTLSNPALVFSNANLSSQQLVQGRQLVGGGAVAPFAFRVTATSSGATLISSATVTAKDVNTAGSLAIAANTTSGVSVTVQRIPELSISSIVPATAIVSVGQRFLAVLTLRNNGQAGARVTGGNVVVSTAALTATTIATDATIVGGGQHVFAAQLTAVSTPSASLTSATFTARDVNSSRTVALTPNPSFSAQLVTVQRKAALKLVRIQSSASVVKSGENVSVSITVQNTGQAAAILRRCDLVVSDSRLAPQTLTLGSSVPGGGITTLTFTVGTTGHGVSQVTSAVFDAVDGNDRAATLVLTNAASPAQIGVESPPGFKITTIRSAKTALAIGESMDVTVTAKNDGGGAVVVNAAHLVLGTPVLSAPDLTSTLTISGNGGQHPFIFRVTGVSAGSFKIETATFDARTQEFNTPVGLIANEGRTSGPTVTVLERASLKIEAITYRARATVGQSFPVNVRFKNTGGGTARLTSVSISPGASLTAAALTGTFDIPSLATQTFSFTATAVSAGAVTVSTAAVAAREVGSNVAIGVTSNDAAPAPVVLERAPALNLLALTASRTTALEGETVGITARIGNSGGASIVVTRATLTFDSTRLNAPNVTSSITLTSGATADLSFTATAASTGTCQVTSATFKAFDANTLLAVPVASNSATAPSVTIKRAPKLKITSVVTALTRATVGQSFNVTVNVSNTGSAAANFTHAFLTNVSARLAVLPLVEARTLQPQSSISFTFPVTAHTRGRQELTTAAFTVTSAFDNSSVGLVVNDAITTSAVTVQDPPKLRVTGLRIPAAAFSQKRTLLATVTVTNEADPGQATMRVTAATLTFEPPNAVQVVSPFTRDVPASSSADITLTMRGEVPGAMTLSCTSAAAVDVNDGKTVTVLPSSALPVGLRVRTRPSPRIASIQPARDIASIGQSFNVTVTFVNDGEDAATLNGAALIASGAGVTPVPSVATKQLPGSGGSAAYTFPVAGTSAGEADFTTATANAIWTETGESLPLSPPGGSLTERVVVQSVPALRITTLSASRMRLSTDQAFSILVGLQHVGGAAIDLQKVLVSHNTGMLSVPAMTLSTVLNAAEPGQGQTLLLTFDARARSSPGRTNISTLTVDAFDRNTGSRIAIAANGANRQTLEVQSRPVPRLVRVTADRITATVGQTVVLTATVENTGQAQLAIERVSLISQGPASVPTSAPGPAAIDGSKTRDFTFRVAPGTPGLLTATGITMTARDANSGLPVGQSPLMAKEAGVLVQTAPFLRLDGLELERALVSVGDAMRVTAVIANAGQATARVSRTALEVTTGWSGTVLASAFDLAGGETARVSFTLTAVATGVSLFEGVDVTATDANTGAAVPGDFDDVSPQQVVIKPANRPPVVRLDGPDVVHVTDDRPFTAGYDASRTIDPDNETPLLFSWSATNAAVSSPATTATSVTFSAAGQAELRLRVTDARGAAVVVTRRVMVASNASPVADAGPDRLGVAGFRVRVSGAGRDADGDALSYRWTQLAGASVALTGGSSASVHFTPAETGEVRLALEVSDGRGGFTTDSVAVSVEVTSFWTLALDRGANLVSPPVRPLGPSGETLRAVELLAATSSTFLGRCIETGERAGRLEAVAAALGRDFELERGRGYLLIRAGPARTFRIPGGSWPRALPSRRLEKGIHAIGLVAGPNSPADSEDLRAICGAGFLTRTAGGRFQIYVPQLSPKFPVETGRGYLLTVPSARDVVIPER